MGLAVDEAVDGAGDSNFAEGASNAANAAGSGDAAAVAGDGDTVNGAVDCEFAYRAGHGDVFDAVCNAADKAGNGAAVAAARDGHIVDGAGDGAAADGAGDDTATNGLGYGDAAPRAGCEGSQQTCVGQTWVHQNESRKRYQDQIVHLKMAYEADYHSVDATQQPRCAEHARQLRLSVEA
eukprot:4323528-Pleurochrysis_carterae.AAC.1